MDRLTLIHKGTGTAAILGIHGILGVPSHFDWMLPAFPEAFSIYSLQLPGHGGTVADFSHSSLKQWIQHVNDAVEELSLNHSHIILLGHSLGTLLSVQAALAYPDKVHSLIAFSMPLSIFMHPKMWLRCLSVIYRPYAAHDVWTKASLESYGTQRDPKLWRYIAWIPRFLELFYISRKTCLLADTIPQPVYCFQSQKDELVSSRSLSYLKRIPHLHLRVLEESGHYYYPEEDRKQVLLALSSISEKILTSLHS